MENPILITGGNGFLGSQLARALAERGERVIVYDNLITGLPSIFRNFEDRIKLVQGDILDWSFLMRTIQLEGVKRIIHTAALASIQLSIEKPALTAKVNIEGTINILEAARIVGMERVLDTSSARIYGHFQYEPADENHPLIPTIPYSITKLAAEKYDDFFHRFCGLDVVTIRTSWVYGLGLPRKRPPRNFIENSLQGIPTTMRTGGDHRVDHTYIDDFVQGALLAFYVKDPKNRIFNITSGKAYTFREMAQMVEKIIPGAKITVGPGFLKYTEGMDAQRTGALDIRRARSELGYQPRYDLFEGLEKYTDVLRKG